LDDPLADPADRQAFQAVQEVRLGAHDEDVFGN
jgi:hypothetical protein